MSSTQTGMSMAPSSATKNFAKARSDLRILAEEFHKNVSLQKHILCTRTWGADVLVAATATLENASRDGDKLKELLQFPFTLHVPQGSDKAMVIKDFDLNTIECRSLKPMPIQEHVLRGFVRGVAQSWRVVDDAALVADVRDAASQLLKQWGKTDAMARKKQAAGEAFLAAMPQWEKRGLPPVYSAAEYIRLGRGFKKGVYRRSVQWMNDRYEGRTEEECDKRWVGRVMAAGHKNDLAHRTDKVALERRAKAEEYHKEMKEMRSKRWKTMRRIEIENARAKVAAKDRDNEFDVADLDDLDDLDD